MRTLKINNEVVIVIVIAILNFKGIFLETMFFRTVSVMSQNLLDQLTRNFKHAFSTCVTIATIRINQKTFYIFPKFDENMQKSIIELQSIATFLNFY